MSTVDYCVSFHKGLCSSFCLTSPTNDKETGKIFAHPFYQMLCKLFGFLLFRGMSFC